MSPSLDSLLKLLTDLKRLPLREPADLRARVQAHLEEVRNAAGLNIRVDVELAAQVAEVLTELIDGWDGLSEDQRLWVQAGARYFTHAEYGEHDFDSIVGFDDDVQVVNLVLERIERGDLFIELD